MNLFGRTATPVKQKAAPPPVPREIIPSRLLLGAAPSGEPVYLRDDDSLKHLAVMGRTGSGKTSFLLGLIYQQIQRGGGYIFIDGKVSRATVDQIYYLSRLAMRESLFRIFNPAEPTITHTYNPLVTAIESLKGGKKRGDANVAELIIKLLDPIPEGSNAQHYHTLTLNLLSRVASVFHKIGKAVTIRDLLEVLSHMDIVYPILSEELEDANAVRDLVEFHKQFKKEILKNRDEKYEGLDAKINTILASPAAAPMCSPGSDIDFYNAIVKNQNVYIGLPMDRDPSTAAGLGRLILTDIRFAISEVLSSTSFRPKPPFLIIMDEFGSYATADFAVVFEKAREANVIVVAAIQAISNLTDKNKMLSGDFAERILGNSNKVFMAVESAKTAEQAEKYWGKTIARRQSHTLGESRSEQGQKLSISRLINPGTSRGYSAATRWLEAWEPKIQAHTFVHELDIGEAYVRHNKTPVKIKVAHADIEPPHDLDIAKELPKFNQGDQTPLNLSYKVNQAIARKMKLERPSPNREMTAPGAIASPISKQDGRKTLAIERREEQGLRHKVRRKNPRTKLAPP